MYGEIGIRLTGTGHFHPRCEPVARPVCCADGALPIDIACGLQCPPHPARLSQVCRRTIRILTPAAPLHSAAPLSASLPVALSRSTVAPSTSISHTPCPPSLQFTHTTPLPALTSASLPSVVSTATRSPDHSATPRTAISQPTLPSVSLSSIPFSASLSSPSLSSSPPCPQPSLAPTAVPNALPLPPHDITDVVDDEMGSGVGGGRVESASGTGSGPASGSTSGPRVDAAGAAERKRAKLRQKKKEYKERKRRRRGGESDEALLDEEDEQAVDGGDPLSPAEAVCLVQELPDQLVMDGANIKYSNVSESFTIE